MTTSHYSWNHSKYDFPITIDSVLFCVSKYISTQSDDPLIPKQQSTPSIFTDNQRMRHLFRCHQMYKAIAFNMTG